MGAWGHGSFENDDALDWVSELEESDDRSVIMEAFETLAEFSADERDAPECSMALAAAEVVAALRGRGSDGLPPEVTDWIQGKPAPDAALVSRARQAVESVLAESELRELWEENTEDFPKWQEVTQDLLSRLAD